MKKLIVGGAVLVLILVALRRFGPALGERAMAKCQEMMTGHRKDEGAGLPDQDPAAKDMPTPAVA
jgi:hypothetical protein